MKTAGAQIAYRASGTGPHLFLVGAPAGISGFSALAAALAHAFTVVIHDPRGIGDSTLEDDAAVDASAFADDLYALIRHLSARDVLLFGASGGAVTGLELLSRYPDAVKLLVAHEPPLFRLLGGDVFARSETAFHTGATDPAAGVRAFMQVTEIMTGAASGPPLPPPTAAESEKQKFFITRMAPATVRYVTDIDRLRGCAIACAAGEQSRGQPAHRAAYALADALGAPFLLAPGDHTAPSTQAASFAPWLKQTIERAVAG
ncbi:alpha/beta fold hydrolase [Terricaulis sp.]|uniref:alpha/beta fold hydrolase n=1 Tax=Terricaulis sp. TaxID=2768686 RepID=UPI003784BDF8